MAFTDYTGDCDLPKRTFFQMLADSMVKVEGHAMLNLIPVADNCDDLEDFWDCDNGAPDEQRIEDALVNNLFALDDCGRLGLKVFYNNGEQ